MSPAGSASARRPRPLQGALWPSQSAPPGGQTLPRSLHAADKRFASWVSVHYVFILEQSQIYRKVAPIVLGASGFPRASIQGRVCHAAGPPLAGSDTTGR